MGLMFSEAEFAVSHYHPVYSAKELKSDDAAWTLELTAKADTEPPYGKLQLVVDKKLVLPTKIKYFNEKGDHVKTETRTEYKCEGEVCVPGKTKLVDHSRGDAWSELVTTEWSVDTGKEIEDFNVRALQRR